MLTKLKTINNTVKIYSIYPNNPKILSILIYICPYHHHLLYDVLNFHYANYNNEYYRHKILVYLLSQWTFC